MELKGIIKEGSGISLTCCDSIRDVLIDDISLYHELESLFKLDSEEFCNNSSKQSPKYTVRYVILDDKPSEDISFEQQAAETVINNMIGANLIYGCYSEWTCGYGGFDYVINDGHSIFEEFSKHIGKYVHFII